MREINYTYTRYFFHSLFQRKSIYTKIVIKYTLLQYHGKVNSKLFSLIYCVFLIETATERYLKKTFNIFCKIIYACFKIMANLILYI